MFGSTWNIEQLESIIKINKEYEKGKIVISELYGSLRNKHIPLLSARADYRIPECDIEDFKKYVQKARENDIEINYTCNAPLVNSVHEIFAAEEEYAKWFIFLEEIGVNRVTVANPLLLGIIDKYAFKLKIEISTIMHSSFATNLDYYQNYNIDRICPNIYLNRNWSFLKEYNRVAEQKGIEVQLLANEFCMYGSTPCFGVYRLACYTQSSFGGNEEMLYDNWPFNECAKARAKNPSSWLKAPFILPQHLHFYMRETGVFNFKISGRTNSIQHVNHLISAYMKQSYNDKLMKLWIEQGNQGISKFNVTVEELQEVNFFDRLLNKVDCNYDCAICRWCDEKYAEIKMKHDVLPIRLINEKSFCHPDRSIL